MSKREYRGVFWTLEADDKTVFIVRLFGEDYKLTRDN
jgi:hypothetical protein